MHHWPVICCSCRRFYSFSSLLCNRLRAPAIRSCQKKSRTTTWESEHRVASHSQIHKRNRIESINNLFGDYFQSTIHMDHQHAHTRSYCRCEHPSLSVILKHFAFFSFHFYACKQTNHSLNFRKKGSQRGGKKSVARMKTFKSWALVRPTALHCQPAPMAGESRKIIENAENRPNYRETTQ